LKTAAAKPGWPNPGDRWVYEVRNTNGSETRFNVIVTIRSVSPATIVEQVMRTGAPTEEITHKRGYYLGNSPGALVFSPYLRAFQELRESGWTGIDLERIGNCASIVSLDCSAKMRMLGTEPVTVRAGTFNARKIIVEFTLRGEHGTAAWNTAAEMTYWYAESARRFVKLQSRLLRGPPVNPHLPVMNLEMELLTYEPAR
jgi:hypothetical protein